ncbi:unnamed protein product [Amoebophrya sp. A120]|nr:unnamed protein product [Amoebophrya sp. A120]|eukprot:GSA120T00008765001.1
MSSSATPLDADAIKARITGFGGGSSSSTAANNGQQDSNDKTDQPSADQQDKPSSGENLPSSSDESNYVKVEFPSFTDDPDFPKSFRSTGSTAERSNPTAGHGDTTTARSASNSGPDNSSDQSTTTNPPADGASASTSAASSKITETAQQVHVAISEYSNKVGAWVGDIWSSVSETIQKKTTETLHGKESKTTDAGGEVAEGGESKEAGGGSTSGVDKSGTNASSKPESKQQVGVPWSKVVTTTAEPSGEEDSSASPDQLLGKRNKSVDLLGGAEEEEEAETLGGSKEQDLLKSAPARTRPEVDLLSLQSPTDDVVPEPASGPPLTVKKEQASSGSGTVQGSSSSSASSSAENNENEDDKSPMPYLPPEDQDSGVKGEAVDVFDAHDDPNYANPSTSTAFQPPSRTSTSPSPTNKEKQANREEEAKKIVQNLLEIKSLTSNKPSNAELKQFCEQCVKLKSNSTVVAEIIQNLSFYSGDDDWRTRLRLLYGVKQLFYESKSIFKAVLRDAEPVIEGLAEMDQTREIAMEVLNLKRGVPRPSAGEAGASASDAGPTTKTVTTTNLLGGEESPKPPPMKLDDFIEPSLIESLQQPPKTNLLPSSPSGVGVEDLFSTATSTSSATGTTTAEMSKIKVKVPTPTIDSKAAASSSSSSKNNAKSTAKPTRTQKIAALQEKKRNSTVTVSSGHSPNDSSVSQSVEAENDLLSLMSSPGAAGGAQSGASPLLTTMSNPLAGNAILRLPSPNENSNAVSSIANPLPNAAGGPSSPLLGLSSPEIQPRGTVDGAFGAIGGNIGTTGGNRITPGGGAGIANDRFAALDMAARGIDDQPSVLEKGDKAFDFVDDLMKK